MAVLFRNHDCPTCGGRHNFCDATADHEAEGDYGFTCPQTGRSGTLHPSGPSEVVKYGPQGAVCIHMAAVTG